jgi:starvation-inducible outer membrane lipoprotein
MRIFACALLLCGCAPSLPQKLKQVQQDQQTYSAAARERATADQCSQTSIPGTTEHLACRLGVPVGPATNQP